MAEAALRRALGAAYFGHVERHVGEWRYNIEKHCELCSRHLCICVVRGLCTKFG